MSITTNSQINEELRKMDESLSMGIDSGNVDDFYQFNVSHQNICDAVHGKYRAWNAEALPTFHGHIHVDKKYEYLLNSIRP
jgi:hypothetical protein